MLELPAPENPGATDSVLIARTNEGFDRVEFSKLTDAGRALLLGAIIIRRHVAIGTAEKLKAIQAARTEKNNRSSCTASHVLFVMAVQLGVFDEHCAGLLVGTRGEDGAFKNATRDEIALAAGVALKSTYPVMRDLAAVGAIQRINMGGPSGDKFVLIMPPKPKNEEPIWSGSNDPTAKIARAPEQASLPEQGSDDASSGNDKGLARAPEQASLPEQGSSEKSARPRASLPLGARFFGSQSDPKPPSLNANEDARAPEQGSPETDKAIAIAKAFKELRALEGGKSEEGEGRSILSLLIGAGVRPPQAATLSKHPYATRERVMGSIRKCDRMEAENRLTKTREAFITANIKNRWSIDPSELEQQVAELPEHEQDVIHPLIEAGAARDGGVATLFAPAANPQVDQLTKQITTAAPNPNAEVDAARLAADQSRRAVIQRAPSAEELLARQAALEEQKIIAERKARLAALGEEKLNALIDQLIASTSDPFMRTHYERSRANALNGATFTAALVRLIDGGQP